MPAAYHRVDRIAREHALEAVHERMSMLGDGLAHRSGRPTRIQLDETPRRLRPLGAVVQDGGLKANRRELAPSKMPRQELVVRELIPEKDGDAAR